MKISHEYKRVEEGYVFNLGREDVPAPDVVEIRNGKRFYVFNLGREDVPALLSLKTRETGE